MSGFSFTLNDGAHIPFVGFGTGTALYGKDATESVKRALVNGVIHLDGAQAYNNEDTLGAAIIASGKPREGLFVTTKLASLKDGETPVESLKKSLARLKLNYVDLYLIHMPRVHYKKNLKEVWKGFEEAKSLGLAKSIGVSNSGIPELEQILEVATIVPAVNQIEFSPYTINTAGPIYKFCKEHKIITAAYGSLAPINSVKGGPVDPVLASIRERLRRDSGKTVTEAQILGKWLYQKGIVFISTTSKKERLEEYMAISQVPDLTVEEIGFIEEAGLKKPFQKFASAFPSL